MAEAELKAKIEEKYQFRNPIVNFFQFHWRGIAIMLLPVVLLPICFLVKEKYMITLYITLVMGFLWVFELVPLFITGMIPIMAFPLTGIISSENVCRIYFKSVTVLFIGSLMAAAAIEYSNLHKRLALGAIKIIGFSASRIHCSIFVITFVLSAWISNAAACALMCPIINALLEEMEAQGLSKRFDDSKDLRNGKKQPSKLALCMYVSVCFSASMGGCVSLIGSPTNLAFKGIYEEYYPDSNDIISFGKFSAYNFPSMVVILILTIVYLEVLYMGMFRKNSQAAQESYMTHEARKAASEVIRLRYEELGSWTIHEIIVCISFMILICLFFTHNPGFAPGWGTIFFDPKYVNNVVPVTTIVLLYFIIPIRWTCFNYCCKSKRDTAPYHREPVVLTWAILNKSVTWGLIFLFGGGFSLAEAAKVTGLTVVIGEKLTFLNNLHKLIILFVVVCLTVLFSSITANTAMVNIILPVVNEISLNIKSHPLYLILPSGTACSMAYLFPVSTPPNAMIAEYGNISSTEMAKAGIGPTLISILIVFGSACTYGFLIYPTMHEFPSWAVRTNVSIVG